MASPCSAAGSRRRWKPTGLTSDASSQRAGQVAPAEAVATSRVVGEKRKWRRDGSNTGPRGLTVADCARGAQSINSPDTSILTNRFGSIPGRHGVEIARWPGGQVTGNVVTMPVKDGTSVLGSAGVQIAGNMVSDAPAQGSPNAGTGAPGVRARQRALERRGSCRYGGAP